MHKFSMLIYCLMRQNVELRKLTGISFDKVMFTHNIMRILITRTICNICVHLKWHGIRKDSQHHNNTFNLSLLLDMFELCIYTFKYFILQINFAYIFMKKKFTSLVSSFFLFLQFCFEFIFLFRSIKNLVFDAHYRSSSSEQQIKQRCDVYLGCY